MTDSGLERWWDGDGWTDIRRDVTIAEVIEDRMSAALLFGGMTAGAAGLGTFALSGLLGNVILTVAGVSVVMLAILLLDPILQRAERAMKGRSRLDWWSLPLGERFNLRSAAWSLISSPSAVMYAWHYLRRSTGTPDVDL